MRIVFLAILTVLSLLYPPPLPMWLVWGMPAVLWIGFLLEKIEFFKAVACGYRVREVVRHINSHKDEFRKLIAAHEAGEAHMSEEFFEFIEDYFWEGSFSLHNTKEV